LNDNIIVLGSTGSVGTQALEVASHLGKKVKAISGHSSVKLLEEQIRKYNPDICAVLDEKSASDLKVRVSDTAVKVISGKDATVAAINETDARLVLNAVSGIAGLRPTVETLLSGKELALANKESLVAYGDQIMQLANEKNINIYPVDSEHSAIWQCIGEGNSNDIKKLILTASGGPFFGKTAEEIKSIDPKKALIHPTWKMGKRITVDSATLMNKGFEVIEATKLFALPASKVEVVVHRESIIHSMVEYIDNAVIAQLGNPDMRQCIQYALTYPRRMDGLTEPLDLFKLKKLTFAEPDLQTFPLLKLAYDVSEKGNILPAVMNAADEVAVEMFLQDKISFCDIQEIVERVTLETKVIECSCITIENIESADSDTRTRALSLGERINHRR